MPPVSPFAAGVANRIQCEHRQCEQARARIGVPAVGATGVRHAVGQPRVDGVAARRRAAGRRAQCTDRRLRRTARRCMPRADCIQIATPVEVWAGCGLGMIFKSVCDCAGRCLALPMRNARHLRSRPHRHARRCNRGGSFRRSHGALDSALTHDRAGSPGVTRALRGRGLRGDQLDTQRDPGRRPGFQAGSRRCLLQHEPSEQVNRYGDCDGQRDDARPTAPHRLDTSRRRCVSPARRHRHR